jgi:hypothetical protein
MVERLLVNEGTSSTETRTSGPGSPKGKDRPSFIDEVPVPRRGVSKDA